MHKKNFIHLLIAGFALILAQVTHAQSPATITGFSNQVVTMTIAATNGSFATNYSRIQTNGTTTSVNFVGNPTNTVYTKLSASSGLLVMRNTVVGTNNVTLTFATATNGLFTNVFLLAGTGTQTGTNVGTFGLTTGSDFKPIFTSISSDLIAWPFQNTNGGLYLTVVVAAFSPSYQWQLNGTNCTGVYATSSTFFFNASNPLSSNLLGNYQCIASNTFGATTSAVMNVSYAIPAVYTTQPQSQTVLEGGMLSLNYAATGSISYAQWFHGNSVASGIYTNTSYVIPIVKASDAGNYYVQAWNYGGIYVTSRVAVVTIAKPGANASWKGRPLTRVIADGMTVPGYTNNTITNLISSSPVTFRDGTVHTTAPVAFTNFFAGIFRWRAGQLQTLIFTNNVTPLGEPFNYTAYPSDEGAGRINFSGNTSNELGGMFELQTNGTQSLILSTKYPGGTAVSNRPGYIFHFAGPFSRRGNGVAFASALISSNQSPYAVDFYDGTNLTTIADDLTDLPGVLTGLGSAYTVKYDGQTIVFNTASAPPGTNSGGFYKATPQGAITKLADTGDFKPGSTTTKFTSFGDMDVDGGLVFALSAGSVYKFEADNSVTNIGIAGATYLSAAGPRMVYYGSSSALYRWSDATNELVMTSGMLLDGKQISSIIEVDGQVDDFAVKVKFTDNTYAVYVVTGATPATPIVVSQPANETVYQFGNASFTVNAAGQPPFSYQWFKGASPLTGLTNAFLTLTNVQIADATTYYVRVTDANGASTNSTPAQLTVYAPPAPTVITNLNYLAPGYFGSNVDFAVAVAGQGPLSYTWSKDGTPLNLPNSPLVTITNLNDNSIGNYSVVVGNANGAVTSSMFFFSINPIIVTDPQDVTVPVGSNATISVGAIGVAPLTYQWYRDFPSFAAILNATNASLSFTNVSSASTNRFVVIVHGGQVSGSATSARVVLSVPSAPAITTQPANVSATSGSNVTFSVIASGSSPLFYQWRSNTVAMSGATNASILLTNVSTALNGFTFSVLVTNSVGSAISSNALLTVTNAIPAAVLLKGSAQSNLFTISFAAAIGQHYLVEYGTNLTPAGWSTLTNFTAQSTNPVVQDSIPNTNRFYRVQALVP